MFLKALLRLSAEQGLFERGTSPKTRRKKWLNLLKPLKIMEKILESGGKMCYTPCVWF